MKDIVGYEGLYAITSCGKVWSYRSNRFIQPSHDKDGYYRIMLVKDKQRKNHYVHRLVAMTYLPNPNNYPQVNHIDEVKDHNWINNLEWCDAKYNCCYGNRNVNKSKPVYCVELDKAFSSQRAAAIELGLNSRSISKCCSGIYKSTGGYHWRLLNE